MTVVLLVVLELIAIAIFIQIYLILDKGRGMMSRVPLPPETQTVSPEMSTETRPDSIVEWANLESEPWAVQDALSKADLVFQEVGNWEKTLAFLERDQPRLTSEEARVGAWGEADIVDDSTEVENSA